MLFVYDILLGDNPKQACFNIYLDQHSQDIVLEHHSNSTVLNHNNYKSTWMRSLVIDSSDI